MKQFILILLSLFFLLFPFMTYADELIIKLKSGNAVKVKFSGTIKGVEMLTGTDSIDNIHIITDLTTKESNTTQENTKSTKEAKQADSGKTDSSTKEKEQKSRDRDIRIRIAPPIFGD